MISKSRLYMVVAVLGSVLLASALLLFRAQADVQDASRLGRPPRLRPDCGGLVIPPNIAPLNFSICETGQRFHVEIQAGQEESIRITSRSPQIEIPPRRWRSLLAANRGKDFSIDVYTEIDGRWQKFQSVVSHIAQQDIDSHLVFRVTGPIHSDWGSMGIYQRDLGSFRESAVLEGTKFGSGCVNCHSFNSNSPDTFCVGVRSQPFGSGVLVVHDGEITKLGTKFGYTAWHPNGQIAVFSINKVRQFFHTAGAEVRDVIDLDAALGYYLIGSETAQLVPRAADKQQLESYPAWSPDGRYLYYCSAPILWPDRDTTPPRNFADVKYDLMRISYDAASDTWGEPERVLAAEETGLSILEPRISPDGKFLLFCMCQYGCFPIYQPTSDLYMMNLETGSYTRLEINSPLAEAWHSWSSNSRWIAFSSRRQGGVFTRCFLSYVDQSGRAHKPFVVPQRDPTCYDWLLKSISVPELITGPISVRATQMARAARTKDPLAVDAVSGASTLAETSEPWARGTR